MFDARASKRDSRGCRGDPHYVKLARYWVLDRMAPRQIEAAQVHGAKREIVRIEQFGGEA
jgi:hypothetical protein